MRLRTIRIVLLAVASIAATLFLGAPGRAAEPEGALPPPAPELGQAADQARNSELLKRFDKNGDGKLDEAEKAAAHDIMRQEQETAQANATATAAQLARTRLLAAFDANHDGKLDPAERIAAFDGVMARPADFPGIHNQLIQRFDKNGDGKLDADESVAARKALDEILDAPAAAPGSGTPPPAARGQAPAMPGQDGMMPMEGGATPGTPVPAAGRGAAARPSSDAAVRDLLLKLFDRNGDGKLDDQEMAALRAFLAGAPAP